MIDKELMRELFKQIRVREKPPDDVEDQIEIPLQKQKVFLDDLKAEQMERM